jgi:type III secretion protein R
VLVVVATAFTKIVVVLLIIRNALGVQQMPPNLLVNGLALVLTLYVMAPVARDTYAIATAPGTRLENVADWERLANDASQPLRGFLTRYADPQSARFFRESAQKIWPDRSVTYGEQDLAILIPAFLTSELTRAFQIGFLLYLPFLMIDFAVSAILIALGMQMMSPPQIATPLKLLLFVLVDGWTKLIEGLVLSYAVP